MFNTPGSVLLGVLGIAFGTILVYAGYRNKKVFGENGIIPTALKTGKLANPDKIPPMWGPSANGSIVPAIVPGAAR